MRLEDGMARATVAIHSRPPSSRTPTRVRPSVARAVVVNNETNEGKGVRYKYDATMQESGHVATRSRQGAPELLRGVKSKIIHDERVQTVVVRGINGRTTTLACGGEVVI